MYLNVFYSQTGKISVLRVIKLIFLNASCFVSLLFTSSASYAELRVCNKTSGRIGVAIGVQQGPIRITQGWFNIKANTCEAPVKEDLKDGPYFLYATDYDRGGEWNGSELMCVSDREFYIENSNDCYARGFDKASFRLVSTKGLKNWTLDLNESQTPTKPVEPNAMDQINKTPKQP